MKVSRNTSLKVQYVLDQLLPPILRDSRWFMFLPMKLVFKNRSIDFMTFKQSVFSMTPEEFGALYDRTSAVNELQGETDLNQKCIDEILLSIKHKKVLEVGCGRGYLANLMSESFDVTACDIIVTDSLRKKYPKITFTEGNIESLPFKDGQFDTVVCTHTLEHVQNLGLAVKELRRVAKKQLIIVVPKQRPYKYTFSLHTQFFPYRWSIESAFGHRNSSVIKDLEDWYYEEDITLGNRKHGTKRATAKAKK